MLFFILQVNKPSTEKLTTCPGSCSSGMVEPGAECRQSDLEHGHVPTSLCPPSCSLMQVSSDGSGEGAVLGTQIERGRTQPWEG